MMTPNVWTKSSKTDNSGPWCVEVMRHDDDTVTVRDSKLGDTSPQVTYTCEEWVRFIAGAKLGEFDI